MKTAFDPRSLVIDKLAGRALERGAIEGFMEAYVRGDVPDYQAAALLAAIFARGLGAGELAQWTQAMLASGRRFDFADLDAPVVDKHSTGGVGDKVSIPLAPALVACGVYVPMISGRGLGHTGGTLDKLESIPGFRTALTPETFERVVRSVGCAMAGQSDDLVPADRKLYALRDATGLIASLPLIASSILSKKLAEGISALVLDVKYGSGAFLVDPEEGAELARTMIRLARPFGVELVVLQTAMDRPLGRACGNALEVAEAVECLRGAGPRELRELVCTLGGHLLARVGVAPDPFAGGIRIATCLDDGSALQAFQRMVEAQGGNPAVAEDLELLPRAREQALLRAPRSGWLRFVDVQAVGQAVVALGGGRRRLEDEINPATGLTWLATHAAEVRENDELCLVHHDGVGLEEALEHLSQALTISPEPFRPEPLVLRQIAAAEGQAR